MIYSVDGSSNFDFSGWFQSSKSPISVQFQGLRTTISQSPVKLMNLVEKTLKQKKRKMIFPSIEEETRTHVSTACAAFWLNREEQTLRSWASLQNGLVNPIRVNGRLAWPVAEIKKVLGIS